MGSVIVIRPRRPRTKFGTGLFQRSPYHGQGGRAFFHTGCVCSADITQNSPRFVTKNRFTRQTSIKTSTQERIVRSLDRWFGNTWGWLLSGNQGFEPLPPAVGHPQQCPRHDHIPAKLAQRHPERTGPQRQTQPAGDGTQRIADDRQKGKDQHLRPQMFEPAQVPGLLFWGQHLFGTPPQPIIDDAPQCIAERCHQHRQPEQVGTQRYVGEDGRLRPHRQQGGRNQCHQKDGQQAVLRQGEPADGLIHQRLEHEEPITCNGVEAHPPLPKDSQNLRQAAKAPYYRRVHDFDGLGCRESGPWKAQRRDRPRPTQSATDFPSSCIHGEHKRAQDAVSVGLHPRSLSTARSMGPTQIPPGDGPPCGDDNHDDHP